MVEKKKRPTSAVGDGLSISVPSLFRCPISLEVMKSPVSLCTGVTYDRSSIQKWLDAGHDTCPATMQVLKTKELVPNHTLHRLIQIWSDSANAELNESRRLCKEQARELIGKMRVGDSSVEDLEKVASFVAESEENRMYLVRLDGFCNLIVDLMSNVDGGVAEKAMKITAEIVSMEESEIRKLKETILNSSDCKASLIRSLSKGSSSSLDAKIASARTLEIISFDAEAKRMIAEKEGVLTQLVNLIDHGIDSRLMEAVLACLISLSMVKRVKVRLIRLGLVTSISNLISTTTSVISIERMLKLLETLSSCKEGRKEICESPTCVPAILNKTMKVSKVATEVAVTILWTVCYIFRDEKAQEAVAGNKGLTKILLVMQSNCSAGVRQMAGDVLKMFRVSSKSCLLSYDTETTHITPF